MSWPAAPRLPEKFSTDPQTESAIRKAFTDMWFDLIRPFNQAGLIPYAIVDTAANITNYPATSYPEGALYFSSDTTHLFVDSYASGAPLWVQVT